jgi:anaphase-promoting complex subunit 2
MHHLSSDDENEEINVRHIKRSSNQNRVRYKVSDTTKILVDLYGSEEGFLEEYQNDLAIKYLLDKDIDAKNLAMEIELVKQRFGEYNISRCDVLMKDVKDSQRMAKGWTKEIREDVNAGRENLPLTNENFTTLVASTGYWPVSNHDPLFQMPKTVSSTLENFENVYKVRNPNKRLKYHQNLGSVTIDLDFPSSSHEFKCQPIHALIMSFFSEDSPIEEEFNIKLDP